MKTSQAEKLRQVLSDGAAHSTVELLDRVYGVGHSGIARLGARIKDLRDRGMEIESWKDNENKTVWYYQLKNAPPPKVRMVPKEVLIDGVMHVRFVPARA